MTLSETAAAWAAAIRFEALPREVVDATRMRILDIVGCILAGSRTIDARNAHAAARDAFPGRDGAAVGFSAPVSLAGAALVNGTSALVLEFDDSHLGSTAHVGSPVIGAALPLAVRDGLSGRRLIEAVAVGNELACQLGLVAPGRFTPLGFHATGIFGIFGAIYALAKGLGLSERGIVDAIGIGGSLCASSMAAWEDGSAVKSLHAGLAASSAVTAVSLARHGVSGPAVLFDGRWGFFRAHVQDRDARFAFEGFGERLGNPWEALAIAPKAFPCGHYIQPHVEAILAMLRDHDVEAGAVETITCFLPERVVAMVASPVEEKRRPNTPFHARMSLQHTMAETVTTGRLDKHSFAAESLRDPALNAMADRVGFEIDPTDTDRRRLKGRVRLTLRDGRVLDHTVADMRGMPQAPMSEGDVVAKFRANADGVVPSRDVERVLDALLALETADDVGAIIRPLCIDA